MASLQCLVDGHGQCGGADHGYGGVEYGGGQLADEGQQCCVRGQTVQEQAIVEVAFAQIRDGVGQSAGGGADEAAAVGEIVPGLSADDQTGGQAVGCLRLNNLSNIYA